ncbi:phosphotransferase [Hazenella coriacea]|uniref:Ser/Thr protein kinase RdoA (MazF antagonist) n=1 Tax=Hazenella coriacea TaxID=1179467 RepID=A0A4R3LC85_9BACL|nr:phosphotransferase [Hazenella coriacea]TCS96875.1 Ser/Thr protein kinase RdoA (MazF antagonist) [Hazenella coriacea]
MIAEVEQVRQEIFESVERTFHLQIYSSKQINRGWRNLKWKIETNKGILFVKQYHLKRYPKEKLVHVRKALQLQAILAEQGVPCPKPYQDQDSYLIYTDSCIPYVLTDYCEGSLILPGEANLQQMDHLGQMTGKMHKILSQFPQDPIDWQPILTVMVNQWKNNWKRARDEKRSENVLTAIDRQQTILDRMEMDVFQDCRIGWTHWDLWVDNILFIHDSVAAILDFDRMKVVYPELDVARAILSCSLKENRLNLDLTSAFLQGYNQFVSFTSKELVRSFRLIWCQESAKWVRPEMEERPGTAKRFAEEVLWITKYWDELEEILQDVFDKRN